MKYRDPSTGNFKDLHFKVSDTVPIGAKMLWHSTTAPEGWLICDGSAVSRTTYSALFAVIGTTYGSGNGSTTFNLPDYRDRVPVGYDASDSDFNAIGKKVGAKSNSYNLAHTHTQGATGAASGDTGSTTLTENQIPGHRHSGTTDYAGEHQHLFKWTKQAGEPTSGTSQTYYGTSRKYNNGDNSNCTEIQGGHTHTFTTGYTGGGQGHTHSLNSHTHTNPTTNSALGSTSISTIQSSLVDVFIIKAYQHVAAPGKVRNAYSNNTDDVYSTSYVNSIIESGSNANGRYVKYADGTLICYGVYQDSITEEVSGNITINLPYTFTTAPIIQLTNQYYATPNMTWSVGETTFTTSKLYWIYRGNSTVTGTISVGMIAIGRWK